MNKSEMLQKINDLEFQVDRLALSIRVLEVQHEEKFNKKPIKERMADIKSKCKKAKRYIPKIVWTH